MQDVLGGYADSIVAESECVVAAYDACLHLKVSGIGCLG